MNDIKQKAIVFSISFLFLNLLFYGCGGGGSSSKSFFVLSDCQVSPALVSKSSSSSLTFSWKVDDSYPGEIYYLDIYLSRDDKLDKEDLLLGRYSSNKFEDSVVLSPTDPNYQTLLNAYGGRYYLIFDAYIYDKKGLKRESIKSFPDFILKTKWTVMVYMDGDNSLSGETSVDLSEMWYAGSNGDVNIVVQEDTLSGTTKRYFIQPSEAVLLRDMGELNMADKQTLIDFANWVVDNYPADHYLLVLWNHGGGFKKRSLSTKDICWDVTSNDASMSIPDLHQALSAINQKIGHKIDIVGMDACLMGMLEVAYEIRDTANFMVVSENTEPESGWPYDKVLGYLIKNVDASSDKLAEEIVTDYIGSYDATDEATLSAIDLSKISDLKAKVDALATDLINGLNNDSSGTLKDSLETTIFNNVQRFDDGYFYGISPDDDSYADLYHLASLIKENLSDYQADAQAIIDAIHTAVIANENTGNPVANAHGLSIWFPNPSIYSATDWNEYWNHYAELSFAKDGCWYKFIATLWGI